MSLTVENALPVPYRVVGNQKKTVKNITFDSSYAEGGEPLTKAELGLNVIEDAQCTQLTGSEAETYVVPGAYSPSEEKIHLLSAKTGKELAKETNCEKVKVRVTAYGW